MTTPFLSSATGNPINTKLRVAQQAALGVPAVADFRDFRSNNGVATINKESVDRLIISSGGAPLAQLAGKAVIGARTLEIGDVDPGNRGLLQMLARLFTKYDVTDNDPWWEWIFGLDGGTAPSGYLTVLEDNDILPRMTLYDILVSGMTISAEPGGNFEVNVDLLIGAYHFFGDVTQTAGAASTLPVLTRTFDGNWEPTADKDIYVKITDAADPITVDAKVSAAASYGGNDQPYTLGNAAIRLLDETGARIGKVREQVRLFLASGATLVLNDEFKIPNRRAAWAQSLATERPIASVNTQFYLNNQEVRVEGGWEIRLEWESGEVVQDTSNEQGGTPDISGELNATITFTNRITNLDVQKALHERETLSIVVDAFTEAEIGASGREYRFSVILPACQPEGEMYGVETGGTNKDQAPTLRARVPDSAFTYDGNNYSSHCHILVENDIAAL